MRRRDFLKLGAGFSAALAIPYAGIAPLTSMFFFAPSSFYRAGDARLSVHDSGGLLLLNRKDERIWRPLINPKKVRYSAFTDSDLKGFGLLERERGADRCQDLDAQYERRPSVWVEPKDNWGEGSVDLVELPAETEYFDTISTLRGQKALDSAMTLTISVRTSPGMWNSVQARVLS